ncbi:MtN3-like protein [Phytophthora palmivora]|uniref:Sugar transporter SWEET1 n=1 Tax=Phytophthora palmivora TaxID=4796 RepID=A0A2P4YK29_9STRA|nr:MtN3-like protein [Phytophthora palmivora]
MTVVIAIKILTTIAQIAQRLSPVPDMYRVHKQQDTGVMAFMPLVAMLLCNHVWLLYAYVVKNIFPLFSVCVFGDIILTIYIAIYIKYCPSREYVVKTIVIGTIPFVLVTVYAVLVAVKAIDQPRSQFGDVLGYLANVTTFALFVSPFEKIKLVIKTKSSAAIPVLLCGIIFANSGLWLINGIIDDDLFIVVPNVVGVILTTIQLTLYYIYRPTRHTVGTSDSELGVEVGLEVDTTTKVWAASSPTFIALASPKPAA